MELLMVVASRCSVLPPRQTAITVPSVQPELQTRVCGDGVKKQFNNLSRKPERCQKTGLKYMEV